MPSKKKKIEIQNNLNCPAKGKIINLLDDNLSIKDYEWLSGIIKKSGFIEHLVLPDIPAESAEVILKILNKSTIKNSTLKNITLNITPSSMNTTIDERISKLLRQIQSRLERNRKCIFGIHGGGNIGLGLMADIISRSEFEYQIVATSNNSITRNLVNSVNKLSLKHEASSEGEVTEIKNIRIISREYKDIQWLYTESSMVALCVTSTVLPEIANDIAHALLARHRTDGSGIKILILMNLPNCDKFVMNCVYSALLSITKSEENTKSILAGIDFIPTVIDRIVAPISDTMIREQMQSLLHSKGVTPEEADLVFNNPDKLIANMVNLNLPFNLFTAEKHFSMYVPENFPEAHRFADMTICKDLVLLETVKNKFINGPHAILAWAGALLGCTTIAESIKHPALYTFIKAMMKEEIGPILSAAHPLISRKELDRLEKSFIERCLASKNDPVTRVGRDPLRKLDLGGRIRGTIELARKHHLNISTKKLEQGLAAGFLYAIKGIDPDNPGCQKIREIYHESHDSLAAVVCYSGTMPNGNFSGLHPVKDSILINSVLNKIIFLEAWCQKNGMVKKKNATLSLQPHTLVASCDYLFFNPFYKKEKRSHKNLEIISVSPQKLRPSQTMQSPSGSR